MWADIVNDRLVGLYVEVPLGERVRMWYLHDEASPHFGRPVTEWLNNHFPNQWTDRKGVVAWLPRSPDFNLCYFCLWGWMTQLVEINNVYIFTLLRYMVPWLQFLYIFRNHSVFSSAVLFPLHRSFHPKKLAPEQPTP